MPAVSKAQRRLMGACEHGADWASCPKHMSQEEMHKFASTPEKGLPARKKAKKKVTKAKNGMSMSKSMRRGI